MPKEGFQKSKDREKTKKTGGEVSAEIEEILSGDKGAIGGVEEIKNVDTLIEQDEKEVAKKSEEGVARVVVAGGNESRVAEAKDAGEKLTNETSDASLLLNKGLFTQEEVDLLEKAGYEKPKAGPMPRAGEMSSEVPLGAKDSAIGESLSSKEKVSLWERVKGSAVSTFEYVASTREGQLMKFKYIDPVKLWWNRAWEDSYRFDLKRRQIELSVVRREKERAEEEQRKHEGLVQKMIKDGAGKNIAFKIAVEDSKIQKRVDKARMEELELERKVQGSYDSMRKYELAKKLHCEQTIERIDSVLKPYEEKLEKLNEKRGNRREDIEDQGKIMVKMNLELDSLRKEADSTAYDSYRTHISDKIKKIEQEMKKQGKLLDKAREEVVDIDFQIDKINKGYVYGADLWKGLKKKYALAQKSAKVEVPETGMREDVDFETFHLYAAGRGGENQRYESFFDEEDEEGVSKEKIRKEDIKIADSLNEWPTLAGRLRSKWKNKFGDKYKISEYSLEYSTGIKADDRVTPKEFIEGLIDFYNKDDDSGVSPREFEDMIEDFQDLLIKEQKKIKE